MRSKNGGRKMKKFDTALCDGSRTVALVTEDDYNETSQAEITSRLVDDFGSVEMIGYGIILFGVVVLKVSAIYIFTKEEMDAAEELDQLTYTIHHFNILCDQD